VWNCVPEEVEGGNGGGVYEGARGARSGGLCTRFEDFALVEVVGDIADIAFGGVAVGYFFDAGVRHGCCGTLRWKRVD